MKNYNKAEALGWPGETYHTSDYDPSEMETFANQMADELYDNLKQNALEIIPTRTEKIPHQQLLMHSPTYKMVSAEFDDTDNPSVREFIARVKYYIKDRLRREKKPSFRN